MVKSIRSTASDSDFPITKGQTILIGERSYFIKMIVHNYEEGQEQNETSMLALNYLNLQIDSNFIQFRIS